MEPWSPGTVVLPLYLGKWRTHPFKKKIVCQFFEGRDCVFTVALYTDSTHCCVETLRGGGGLEGPLAQASCPLVLTLLLNVRALETYQQD